jgi:hypothetical protein
MTDLDSNYGGEKMLKDVILCDRCNEDIEQSHFVILESQYVYHTTCCQDDDWFKSHAKKPPINVIPLKKL